MDGGGPWAESGPRDVATPSARRRLEVYKPSTGGSDCGAAPSRAGALAGERRGGKLADAPQKWSRPVTTALRGSGMCCPHFVQTV